MQKHSVPFPLVTLQHQAGQHHQLLPERKEKGRDRFVSCGGDVAPLLVLHSQEELHQPNVPAEPPSPQVTPNFLRWHPSLPPSTEEVFSIQESTQFRSTISPQEGCYKHIQDGTSNLRALGVLHQGAGFCCCCSLWR